MDAGSSGRWIEWTLDREDGRSSVSCMWGRQIEKTNYPSIGIIEYMRFTYNKDET